MKDQALHITNAILFDEDMALKGDLIATLYTTDKPEALEQAAELMLSSTGFWKQAPEQMPLILDVIE